MSQVTVSQLAEVLGISIDKLLNQLSRAGIEARSGDEAVSNDDKKKLLAHLRSIHGKTVDEVTAPRKVTLKRKSLSELRIRGSGPRAATKTVNVEIRKRRTYVKRDALQAQDALDPDREEAVKALQESRDRRELEEKELERTEEKCRRSVRLVMLSK